MKSLKVKKLNKPQLKSFVRTLLNIGEKVYFSIGPDGVKSGMYTQAHDTAILKRVDLKDMMELDSQTEEVRIGLYKDVPERLLKYLDNFDSETLECTINYFTSKNDGINYAQQIDLKDKGLKMSVFCQDPALGYICLTEDQQKIAFDDKNAFFTFDLGRETLSRVNSLLGFVKEPKALIKIRVEDDGLHFDGDVFDMVIDPGVSAKAATSQLFREAFDRIPLESYKARMFKNKVILVSEDSDTRIAINLAQNA